MRERPPSLPEVDEHVEVAIVGGGIAGLSAAWAFERAGFSDFVVVELEDVAGGTSRSGENAVTRFPWGAHYVPAPLVANRPLEALLEEVGALAGRDASGRPRWAEHVLCADPFERLFHMGSWHEGLYPRLGATSEDLLQLERFQSEMQSWASWQDAQGRPAFAVPRDMGSDAPEVRALDAMSMARWLDLRGFTSARLRWLVEYGCRDDFGATLSQISAWAGVHYHAARLRQDGESAPILTWPEGNGRLVRHLAETAGLRLRTGALVRDVVPRESHVDVTWIGADGTWRRLRAGHVVLAVPRFAVRHVLAPWRESPPPFLTESVYGSWVVVNLELARPPSSRGFPIAWDNVIHGSESIGYIVATHQLPRSGRAEETGPTVLTWYRPFTDDDVAARREKLLRARWEELVDEALADLARPHFGFADLVERADVMTWGHGMVRPRPGFCFSEALADASRPLGRVHFAHADLSGLALFEEAQRSGIRAAEAILSDRGAPFTSWLA